MDHMCYLCLVFVILSCLFIAALWLPAGKWLTSLLSFVMFYCVFVTFPYGILGKVWFLIILIPDLCHLSYFYKEIIGKLFQKQFHQIVPFKTLYFLFSLILYFPINNFSVMSGQVFQG